MLQLYRIASASGRMRRGRKRRPATKRAPVAAVAGAPAADGGDKERGLRTGAYRVFTRKRAFLIKSSVTILRTGLHVAVNSDFAHNSLKLANNSHTDRDTVDMD